MKTRISIIIPVYNVEQYVEECLQSVANQTMTEGIECIIVDDRGQDNSMDIVRHFVDDYQGAISFHILKHEKNNGLSAARNTGIKAATGEYIYFLDSDDRISPECMKQFYQKVEKYGKVDLVHGVSDNYDKRMLYGRCEYTVDKKEIKKFLLNYIGSIMSAQDRLLNKDFLIKNDLYFKEGIIHEDCHWSFFLAKRVNSIAFNTGRTYLYTINPNSITNKINIEKETYSFRVIIKDFINKTDKFLFGIQKIYILSCIHTMISNNFCTKEDKDEIISSFIRINNVFERILLRWYFKKKSERIKLVLFRIIVFAYNRLGI